MDTRFGIFYDAAVPRTGPAGRNGKWVRRKIRGGNIAWRKIPLRERVRHSSEMERTHRGRTYLQVSPPRHRTSPSKARMVAPERLL